MRKTASWAPTAALITAIVTLAALPAHACWDEAAARYRVSSELLYAIARTESATRTAITRGDRRAPVVATLP